MVTGDNARRKILKSLKLSIYKDSRPANIYIG